MPDTQFNYDMQDPVESLRIPPHSLQAEQSVIGGLMLDNQCWDVVADQVAPEDFYRKDHRLIFEAISNLAKLDEPFDVVTISEVLEQSGELDNVGGLAYLGTLAKDTPSAANIKSYASIVRQRSVRRQLIHIGNEISDSGFDTGSKDISTLLDEAETKVFKIAEQGAKGQKGFEPIKDLLAKAVERITDLHEHGNSITGVSSGFKDLDEMMSGLQPADLIIVAGRPSMGKTSFAMNLAENVGIQSGMPVAVFSMEMPGDSLAMRMMSSLGRIDQHKVRTGQLEDDEWPRMQSSINLLAEAKIFIDDTAALSPIEVRARSRRLMKEHGQLGLIVLDYLQLMQSPSSNESRVAEISDISRSLKALAKELNVPVVALSQLNRNLEQRPNKRPVMSDLRESGSIEQDADVIIFIYRDEVYNDDSPEKGIAEIIIGKQRNGPIGTCRLTFLGQYTRFENYAHDPYADDEY
ncbi:MAG: replicative DNA helicase [Piscirickettsiaceae bacterium]|nr:MAG: replicative DNA helicase [Piscirickettsiaceae bacterium]PCI70986.1 MAG: replicative DNA helicase [Piscirickettsiaceae bacterium]